MAENVVITATLNTVKKVFETLKLNSTKILQENHNFVTSLQAAGISKSLAAKYHRRKAAYHIKKMLIEIGGKEKKTILCILYSRRGKN